MKLKEHFRNFLKGEVNLNSTRFGKLAGSVQAIESFLRASSYEAEIIDFEPHGSWAHQTIIKPVAGRPFDADLLMKVEPKTGWSAKDYVLELRKVFASSDTYKNSIAMSSHCVTVTYADDRKIDVAPCVINRNGWVQLEVCNKNTDQFEQTNPTEYTNWIIERNSITRNNSFRKVTRLVKYLRDIKTTFSCPSVLLTTLLANCVYDWDEGDTFPDTPTALKVVFGRLDDFLSANPVKPVIPNPKLVTEDFGSLLTDDQYKNFASLVSKYRSWIDEAYDCDTRKESIPLWRKIFGESFASSVVLTEGKTVSAKARLAIAALAKASEPTVDLVTLVRRYGRVALPPGFDLLPYKHEPEWQFADERYPSQVIATLHRTEQAPPLREVESLSIVPKDHGLWFDVRDARGQAFPIAEFRVQWRITNTDEEAFADDCMRGEFNPPKIGNKRWEKLTYRGVHSVEAFVIRRRDNAIISVSDPFYVSIE